MVGTELAIPAESRVSRLVRVLSSDSPMVTFAREVLDRRRGWRESRGRRYRQAPLQLVGA